MTNAWHALAERVVGGSIQRDRPELRGGAQKPGKLVYRARRKGNTHAET